MNSYLEELKRLAPLETFDAGLFAPSSWEDKDVCDLVLCFAVAYNDLKDVAMALRFLKGADPEVNPEISTELGQHSGLGIHLMRIEAGIIKELFVLIEENRSLVESASFSKLTRQLSPRARRAWKAVLSVALQKSTKTSMGRFLLMIRNKVAFHYDLKEISRGYSEAFIGGESLMPPYISRGNSMPETRFYFADAAAEKYFLGCVDKEVAREFITGRATLFDDLNIALYELVTRFAATRGCAWRQV